jgi:hypothetical protein
MPSSVFLLFCFVKHLWVPNQKLNKFCLKIFNFPTFLPHPIEDVPSFGLLIGIYHLLPIILLSVLNHRQIHYWGYSDGGHWSCSGMGVGGSCPSPNYGEEDIVPPGRCSPVDDVRGEFSNLPHLPNHPHFPNPSFPVPSLICHLPGQFSFAFSVGGISLSVPF